MRRTSLSVRMMCLLIAWTCGACDGGGEQEEHCGPPPVHTVTLSITDGLIFDQAKAIAEAELMQVDLICYKAGSKMQLKSGIQAGTTNHQPLHWYQTTPNQGEIFTGLDQIPDVPPSSDDQNQHVHDPVAGNGFVVKNLISSGSHTRVFVASVSESGGDVTLQYQITGACK